MDEVSKSRSIYDAGPGEIFWKNFLAGLGRGLGGAFVYLIFLFILYLLFTYILLPRLMPFLTGLTNLFKTFSSISEMKSSTGNIFPFDLNIQKLLGK